MIQNCQNRSVPIFKMAARSPSYNFSNDMSSKAVRLIKRKLDGKHGSDIEIQNC